MRRSKVGPSKCLTSLPRLSKFRSSNSLASMELSLLISSVVHRYDIEPVEPGKKVSVREPSDEPRLIARNQLATAEGFLRKPLEFNVAMKRREV